MKDGHQNQRIVTAASGKLMVVTDLHGDWDAYRRCKTLFQQKQQAGQAHHIVFCGDLIHRESPPAEDASLKMLLDIRQWQRHEPGRVTYLLGNHELAQLYRIDLRKGDVRYTPRLATEMGSQRPELITYLATLPFYVRTAAGVAIAHAGVGRGMLKESGWVALKNLDHNAVWQSAAAQLSPRVRQQMRSRFDRMFPGGYAALIKDAWNITTPDDPFYDDLLISNLLFNDELGNLLWDTFFTQNEREYGNEYEEMVARFLTLLSNGYQPQRLLITGHIACAKGYQIVNSRQLRMASASHAKPRSEGKVLLFDASQPIHDINALANQLTNLF